MSTVYRQYRPQTFAEVMGQTHITDTLQQAIAKERISHAYLFQGPRGTGKTSTARIFAKRLNCTNPTSAEPCGACDSCKAMTEHRSVDVIEIDAASNRGIDDIRELREHSRLKPAIGKYKVYIIDEVHMLTGEAFAALLKVLEEPVAHVLFILATTELHKVPPTILSRCQVYRFKRATKEEMKARLSHILKAEKRDAEDEVITFITQRSDGCYRDAESLLGQLLIQKKKKLSLDDISDSLGLPDPALIDTFLTALIKKDDRTAVSIVENAYAQGMDPEQFTTECIRTARDGSLLLVTQDEDIFSFTKAPDARAILPGVIRALVQASQDFSYVPEPLIALELAILILTAPTASTRPAVQASPVRTAPAPAPIQRPTAQTPSPAPTMVAPAPAQTPTASTPAPAPMPKAKATPASVEPTPTTPQATATPVAPGAFSIEQATQLWSKVIDQMKAKNPVASTFLKAVSPMEVEGSTLVLRVGYPLHRTFFEKPEQKKALEDILSSLLGAPITTRMQMVTPDKTQLPATPTTKAPTPKPSPAMSFSKPEPKAEAPQEAPAPDNSLYEMAKDVFG